MTTVPRSSTSDRSRAYPVATYSNCNVYKSEPPFIPPNKPAERPSPPGAHLYKDIWMIFKVATQTFLFGCNPEVYASGFIAGAFKGAIEWSENGPPKKIASDAEIIDFGATAHSSSLLSQVYIVAENIFAIVAPIKIESWFPSDKLKDAMPIGANNPNLDSATRTILRQNKEGMLPSTGPQCIKFGFTLYHSILTGEEVVQRVARWIDTSKEKPKERKS